MEPLCVYCGIRTAIVYCNVDFVRLCLQCDLTIHSANNSFSHITHPRSLLCNNCTLQPAILRCFEEDLCFCHDCVCMGNCLQLCHQFQKLRTYTGCPSMDDLTQDLESSCSVFYPNNDKLRCSSLPFNSGYVKESNGESSPSMPNLQNLDYMTNCKDQQGALALDMDKDFQFNIIDSDDIFEWTQSYTECQQVQEAMNTDSVLVDSWITEISNCPAETVVDEAMTLSSSSSGDHHQEQKAAICSSCFSCDNNNNNSTLHSSAIRLDCGSTTTNDYTSPWELNIEGGGNNKQEREEALKRYYAKKKKRTFGKQIRYASRKARADSRKRIQGRFVKAGEAYDYDPFTKETP